jgi:hypothetical protein
MLVCVGTIAILIAILVALLYFYFTRQVAMSPTPEKGEVLFPP